MNKADLVAEVAKVVSSLTESKNAVNRMFEAMIKAIKDGEKVVVHGFGSFHVVMRKSKPARNPRTGEPVIIPPRRRVKFKMAKDLLCAALLLGAAAARATLPLDQTVACPVDGNQFAARSAVSATMSGETDLDATPLTVGWNPLLFHPWTCPRCYFTGYEDDFGKKVKKKRKAAFRAGLKPALMPAAPKESSDFPAWVRYDLYAQRLLIEEAPPVSIAEAYHNAARAVRLASDFPPVDEAYLDRANKRLMDTPKPAGVPDWLATALNVEKQLEGAADARLLALLVHQYHLHGELPAALRHLDALKKARKDPALSAWTAQTEREIWLARSFFEKAVPAYEAHQRQRDDWAVRYLLGDLNRRLARTDKMEEWFALIDPAKSDEIDVAAFMSLGRRLAAAER